MFFKRKAVLLIHGFVGGIYDFGNFQNELQTIRKFDVFTFTLPGHEKMTVKDVKYNEWVDEGRKQVEFLLSKGYHSIYIVGHSMGGVIAAYLASVYPEVKKLVLAAPAFRYFAFEDGKLSVKGFNETLKNIPELLKGEGQDKVIERIRKTPLTTMLEFTNLVNKYQDCLANVTCPVLTIHGVKDKVVPASATKLVHDKVASRTNILVNIKNVPHDCFIKERNSEVKKLIRDFLVNRNHKEKKFIEM